MYRKTERRQQPDGSRTLMSLEYKTAKKRKQPIEFTLDGDKYTFTPQKSAGVILALADDDADETAIIRAMFDWLSEGLSKTSNEKLMKRLKDPKDEFDFEDLQKIITDLQTESSGRPTS